MKDQFNYSIALDGSGSFVRLEVKGLGSYQDIFDMHHHLADFIQQAKVNHVLVDATGLTIDFDVARMYQALITFSELFEHCHFARVFDRDTCKSTLIETFSGKGKVQTKNFDNEADAIDWLMHRAH